MMYHRDRTDAQNNGTTARCWLCGCDYTYRIGRAHRCAAPRPVIWRGYFDQVSRTARVEWWDHKR